MLCAALLFVLQPLLSCIPGPVAPGVHGSSWQQHTRVHILKDALRGPSLRLLDSPLSPSLCTSMQHEQLHGECT